MKDQIALSKGDRKAQAPQGVLMTSSSQSGSPKSTSDLRNILREQTRNRAGRNGRAGPSEATVNEEREAGRTAIDLRNLRLATKLSNLAQHYHNQDKFAEAEPLYWRALTIRERILGAEDASFLATLENLARLYCSHAKYAQAEPLLERALAIKELFLGADHAGLVEQIEALATVYSIRGHFDRSERLFARAYLLRQESTGTDSSEAAWCLSNRAASLSAQGKDGPAGEAYRQSLSMLERLFGPHDPRVIDALEHLASTLIRSSQAAYPPGEDSAAESEMKSTDVLYEMAVFCHGQGRYEQAGQLYRQLIASLDRLVKDGRGPAVSPPEKDNVLPFCPQNQSAATADRETSARQHPGVAQSLDNLARLYTFQGRYEEAEPLFRRALALHQVLGLEHPAAARTLADLGEINWRQGRLEESEKLYRQSLAIREKLLGRGHPDTALSYHGLARVYHLQAKFAQAESLMRVALSLLQCSLKQDHPETSTVLNDLGRLLHSQGNYSQAEPLYKQSLAQRERVLGFNHPLVAEALNNLAELYLSQGKYASAESLSRAALAIFDSHSRDYCVGDLTASRDRDDQFTSGDNEVEPEEMSSVIELSDREIEILQFLAEGMSNQEIARRLDMSCEAINSHISCIMEKLGQGSTEAAARVVRRALEKDQKAP